jgi:glycerophosphoryl diester phosphodiesterase
MRIVTVVALLALASPAALAIERKFEFFQPLVPPRPFQVVARLGRANSAPANSRPAILLAIEDGLEWVELSVRRTKDGQHVLADDLKLVDREQSIAVRDQSLAELAKLDLGAAVARRFSGTRILPLVECLALIKGKINVVLDCQDVDARQLVDEIQQAKANSQVLVGGPIELLQQVRKISGGAIATLARRQTGPEISRGEEFIPTVVDYDIDQITPEICRQWHTRGVQVRVRARGESDRPTFWDQAISAGADLILTDVPEEMIAHVLNRQLKPRPVRFALHRGASRYAPENTLAAYEKAYRLHADFVEFDVRTSQDGQFFLLHDGRLDRTTNGKGPIREATADTISRLDAGDWFNRALAGAKVPTLDEFLSAVPAGVELYFDAKDIAPEALAAALAKHGLVERTVVYQSADYLQRLGKVDARIRRMPPAGSSEQVTALAASVQPYAVDSRWNALSKAYIDHCHAAGILVFADAPFNINVNGYRQAIQWGIDLIQTDYPLRAWRAMELEFAARNNQ